MIKAFALPGYCELAWVDPQMVLYPKLSSDAMNIYLNYLFNGLFVRIYFTKNTLKNVILFAARIVFDIIKETNEKGGIAFWNAKELWKNYCFESRTKIL